MRKFGTPNTCVSFLVVQALGFYKAVVREQEPETQPHCSCEADGRGARISHLGA